MLRTKVKAGPITNLTDARYFAAWEVAWLGFCLDPGDENYISPREVLAIREWVDGPLIVGEFNVQTSGEIAAAIEMLNLDAIQAGMFTDAATLRSLNAAVPVCKEIVVEHSTKVDSINRQIDEFQAVAGQFLLNFDKNGISWTDLEKGRPFSLSFIHTLCRQQEILLSIDLTPPLAGIILSSLAPHGLSIRGGAEEKTGFKSFEELDELLEALQIID